MDLDRKTLDKLLDEYAKESVERDLVCALLATEEEYERLRHTLIAMAEQARNMAMLACHGADPKSPVGEMVARTKEMAEEMLNGAKEPVLKSLHFEGGTLTMNVSHWAARIFALSLGDSLAKPDGTYWNFIEMKANHGKAGDITVTVQRRSGQTPNDQRLEEKKRADALDEKLKAVREVFLPLLDWLVDAYKSPEGKSVVVQFVERARPILMGSEEK